MPLVDSAYAPGRFPRGPHLETILPATFRLVRGINFYRERMETPDGDFLDLDTVRASAAGPSDRMVILSHGLEGHTRRPYILGMARAFLAHGWDALAWNCRGCSGEPNRTPGFYHSGASHDLSAVIDRVIKDRTLRHYRRICLVGFSMGGNITLKYLGEKSAGVNPRIQGAVAISAPCDLAGCSAALARPENRIYMANFLASLRAKIKLKKKMFPDRFRIALREIQSIRTFREFDDLFTGPLHGFRDAADYWDRCSGNRFLPRIRVPTLLLNARNDPFLAESCFPEEAARKSKHVFLETPARGGHVGFSAATRAGLFWSERRTLEFLAGTERFA